MAGAGSQGQGGTATRRRPARAPTRRAQTPLPFRVVLFNDDYTTMEFVIAVLESVFHKTPAEATAVMLKVHVEGRGVAGVYTKEIAEAKVTVVHRRARAAGHPLRAGIEEA